MPSRIYLVGRKFGRLTVIEEYIPTGIFCLCKCECGAFIRGRRGHLVNGHTQSCGCLKSERTRISNTTHGHTAGGKVSRTYRIWVNVTNRCTRPSMENYTRYGGKGVTVCREWNTFSNFLRDMGECPEGKSIDRYPNKKGNYEKSNCRWATLKEQARNKSNNRVFTVNGVTGCLVELCEHFHQNYKMVSARLNMMKWPIDKALLTPKTVYPLYR